MSAQASSAEGIFADYAQQMLRFGLAVVPTLGKVPLIRNWNSWRVPPSAKTIDRFVRQFPDANIAIQPGPSGVFVADVDSVDQVDEVECILGRTPLHVATSRGRHLYYRHVNHCCNLPGTLRKLGLNVDLKRGNSIVIAPPSKHQSGTTYEHMDCDWRDLQQIPPPNVARLHKLLDEPAPSTLREPHERCIEGERGLGLNRLLCRQAVFCETFDELVDVASTINDDFLPPLRDAEVMKRAKDVWKDVQSGKIVRMIGRRAVARTRAAEITHLSSAHRNGSDAYMLLMFLRTQHGARYSRGNTFAIAAEAMHRAQTLPGWHWKRISAARKLLLSTGFIEQVAAHKVTRRGMVAAQYRFGRDS